MRRSFRWRRPPLGLGVDLGSAGVKAVVLAHDEGGIGLVAAGREALASGAVEDGAVRDAEAVGAALARLLARLGVRRRPVSLALGGSSVLIKRFPAAGIGGPSGTVGADEFRDAVAREAARHVPFHLESLEFDYEGPDAPAGETAPGVRGEPAAIVFGAAPRETVRNHCRAADLAGREVRRVELEPYALYAAVRLEARLEAPGSKSGVLGLVEIGATRTGVHVFRRCPESADAPGGAGDLLASVAAPGAGTRAFGVEPAADAPAGPAPAGNAAPGEPLGYGLRDVAPDGSERSGGRIAAAVGKALQEAATSEPVRLRISGGGAGLAPVHDRLAELELGDPVVLDPLAGLGFGRPAPAFAVAAGLAYQQLLEPGGS